MMRIGRIMSLFRMCHLQFFENIAIACPWFPLNRYVLIVHPANFETLYSSRNTLVILLVTWMYFPLLCLLPLSELWVIFFGHKTMSLKSTSHKRRISILRSRIHSSCDSVAHLLSAILYTILSGNNLVNTMSNENMERMQQQRRFVRSVLVMISVFIFMNTPFIVTSRINPQEDRLWAHDVSMYLSMISYSINTFTYSVMNKQMRI